MLPTRATIFSIAVCSILLGMLLGTDASAQIGRPLSPGDDPLRDRWEFDPVRVDHELFIAANLALGDAALGIAYPKGRDFPGDAPVSLYRRLPATEIVTGAAGRIMGTPFEQVALLTEDATGTHVDVYSGLLPGQVHVGRHDLPPACLTPSASNCRIAGHVELLVGDLDGFDASRPDLGTSGRCLASNRRHDEVIVAYPWRTPSSVAGQMSIRQELLSWEGVSRSNNKEPPSTPTWVDARLSLTDSLAEGERFRLLAAQVFPARLVTGRVTARDLLLVYPSNPIGQSPPFNVGVALVTEALRLRRDLNANCNEIPLRQLNQVDFAADDGEGSSDEPRLIEVIGGPVAASLPARRGWDVATGNARELQILDGDDNQLITAIDAIVSTHNAIDNSGANPGQVNANMGLTLAIRDPAGGQSNFILRNNTFPISDVSVTGVALDLLPDARVRLQSGLVSIGKENFSTINIDSTICLMPGFWVQTDTIRGPVIQGLFVGDDNQDSFGPPLLDDGNGDAQRLQPMWPSLAQLGSRPLTGALENLQFAAGGFQRDRNAVDLSEDSQCVNLSTFSGDIDSLYIARPAASPFAIDNDAQMQVVGNVGRSGDTLSALSNGNIRPLALLGAPDHLANVGTELVSVNMDIDGNILVDAATDGAMLLNFLLGLRGDAITANATLIGDGCSRCDSASIEAYLRANEAAFDADDNGIADGLSDGLLRLRFQQGATGAALTNAVVAANCRRCSAAELAAYLLVPLDDPAVEVPVLLAFDADANSAHYRRFEFGVGSIYLSEGANQILNDIETFDVILGEPPKHIDFLPALGGISNISVTADLVASFETTQTQSQEITSETSTDFTLSDSASTTRTVSAGLDLFGVASGSVEASVTTLTENEFNETSANFQSESSSFSITQISRTERDDQLVTRLNDLYVWRYPAMNLRNSTGAPASERFLEIFQPSRSFNFFSAGKVNDAYQPWHTNNNLLGYPVFVGNDFQPGIDEVGDFRVGAGGSSRNEPIWNESAFTVGGLSFEQRIEFTESTSDGTSLVTSNTVTETRDTSVKASADVAGSFKGIGVSAGFSEERNWQASSAFSYAQSDLSNTSTDAQTAISLSIPGNLTGERGYRFHPAWFFTADGGLKLTHAVALEGMGVVPETFWQSLYSGPDPALNLPFIFTLDVSTTVPDIFLLNTDPSRSSMKGMFFREGRGINPRNPSAQRGIDLSFAPRAGDPVQIEARVYNLSLATPVENLKVRFEAQRFELGQDTGPRVFIGEARIPSLPYRGQIAPDPAQPLSELAHVQSAYVLWDTTAFGSDIPDRLATWKVFVVLDPDDEINAETHELIDRFDDPLLGIDGQPIDPLPGVAGVYLEKGQNNTGWGLLRIAPAAPGDNRRAADEAIDTDDLVATLALVAADGDAQRELGGQVALEQPLALRLTLAATRLTTRTQRVLIYAGDPTAGGKLIAYRQVTGLDAGGIDLIIPWQPERAGRHDLYLVFADASADNRSPQAPTLTVNLR